MLLLLKCVAKVRKVRLDSKPLACCSNTGSPPGCNPPTSLMASAVLCQPRSAVLCQPRFSKECSRACRRVEKDCKPGCSLAGVLQLVPSPLALLATLPGGRVLKSKPSGEGDEMGTHCRSVCPQTDKPNRGQTAMPGSAKLLLSRFRWAQWKWEGEAPAEPPSGRAKLLLSRSPPRRKRPHRASTPSPWEGRMSQHPREGVSVGPLSDRFPFSNSSPFPFFQIANPFINSHSLAPPRSHYSRPSRGEGVEIKATRNKLNSSRTIRFHPEQFEFVQN